MGLTLERLTAWHTAQNVEQAKGQDVPAAVDVIAIQADVQTVDPAAARAAVAARAQDARANQLRIRHGIDTGKG